MAQGLMLFSFSNISPLQTKHSLQCTTCIAAELSPAADYTSISLRSKVDPQVDTCRPTISCHTHVNVSRQNNSFLKVCCTKCSSGNLNCSVTRERFRVKCRALLAHIPRSSSTQDPQALNPSLTKMRIVGLSLQACTSTPPPAQEPSPASSSPSAPCQQRPSAARAYFTYMMFLRRRREKERNPNQLLQIKMCM